MHNIQGCFISQIFFNIKDQQFRHNFVISVNIIQIECSRERKRPIRRSLHHAGSIPML